MKYLKANKALSAKILDLTREWDAVISKAKKLARKVGASRSAVYTANGFSRQYVSGFIFSDESKVDKKQFVRVKNTRDGWRPRRNGSELAKQFDALNSEFMGKVMGLCGMKLFGTDMRVRTPGIHFIDGTAYLTVSDDTPVKPGFTRISDVQMERIKAKNVLSIKSA